VQWQERLGDATYLYVGGESVLATWTLKAPGAALATAGQRIAITVPAQELHLFDALGMAVPRCMQATEMPIPQAA
jgi:multiple sugar transport system ATP-binding protein